MQRRWRRDGSGGGEATSLRHSGRMNRPAAGERQSLMEGRKEGGRERENGRTGQMEEGRKSEELKEEEKLNKGQ